MNNLTKGAIGAGIFFVVIGFIANSSENPLGTGELLGQYLAIGLFFGLGVLIANKYIKKKKK